MLNLITYAIPVFFLSIFVEAYFSYKKKKDYYRLNDSVNSLSCGIISELLRVFYHLSLFGAFAFLHSEFRISDIFNNTEPLTILILFLLVDLIYYWFHRFAHEINFMWATHIVHHNSEEYNLTTALRQGPFQAFASFPLFLPLAFLGFDPVLFAILRSVNTVYQFWIHTRFVGDLKFMDGFFNTPANHRVHHAKNLEYLDKNYGGILIIWDRLFGTYKKEENKISFGITRKIESFNPMWSIFHWWKMMFKRAEDAPGLLNKGFVFIKGPGWRYEGDKGNPYLNDPEYLTKKYNPVVGNSIKRNLLVLFVLLVITTLYVLVFQGILERALLLSLVLTVVVLLGITGTMFNGNGGLKN